MDDPILAQHDPDRLYWEVEITKSQRDGATGDYIIEGIANTGKKDIEGDSLVPSGIDYSYFLKKGFIKWEHYDKRGLIQPVQFVGEPIEARITSEGFYIKARLFGKHKLVPQIVEQMETLEKSGSSRRMGFSIEGQALKRDQNNPGQVTKSVIRNVALTMNGVDTETWARIAKSLDLTSPDNVEFDLEKTLDTTAAAPIMPQSLEGANPEPDSYNDFAKRVRLIVGRWLGGFTTQAKRRGINRHPSARMLYRSLTADQIALDFYFLGEQAGLADEQLTEATRYGYDRAALLKGIALKLTGGELQVDNILKSLDLGLEELSKAFSPDENKDQDDQDQDQDEDEYDDDDDGEPGEEGQEGTSDDDVHKSLDLLSGHESEGNVIEKAIEVSEFLEMLVGQVSTTMDGFSDTLEKSLGNQRTVNNALIKGLSAIGGAVKALVEERDDLKTQVSELSELVKSIAAAPVGRKSVVNPREVQTLNKSLGGTQQQGTGQTLTKSMVLDNLIAGVQAGQVPVTEVTLFETSGRIGAAGRQYMQSKGIQLTV